MFIAVVTTALAVLGQAPTTRLVSYDEAVRCAGLTQAASELEGGESRYGRTLYDAALYWSLAAMQAATAAGRDPVASENDQTRARLDSVKRLSAGEAEARAVLTRCRQKTPRLG
ncbi:hypothetical protein HNP32_000070 [Brevundimonas bullata]|uniref:Uncharacterized protein n=1 Tax=Brevundimonas bullata TaxID=13160 RepID=A0A7W7IL45_9CAUL|nr:hypothetical protein [Brevundimonas bullata]MBB4796356.1 hypothetical protein [Brevundimonas bullata]MBB6381316.1 hypothetical protein [Brevundimonas bullata]